MKSVINGTMLNQPLHSAQVPHPCEGILPENISKILSNNFAILLIYKPYNLINI